MKKKIVTTKQSVVIYRDHGRDVSLRADFGKETIWATQNQIAEIFGTQRPAITKHLLNIFKTQELDEKSVSSILELTAKDGKRYKTQFYSLDAIIAFGYRVNSKNATQFRIWATKTLREHILKGFTINKKVLIKNHKHFLKTVSDIQALLPTHVTLDPKGILDLVKEFSVTWTKIDAYDKDKFSKFLFPVLF